MSKIGNPVRWGILGCGEISSTVAQQIAQSNTGQLVAVASRSMPKALAFGHPFLPLNAVKRYGAYEELLSDTTVEAIYVATPHSEHARWAMAAAQAGKHLLIEKPIGLNSAEAMVVFEVARRNGVFAMEAYMYRCHPQMLTVLQLIKSNAIGKVLNIDASFAFMAGVPATHRLLNKELGGGGMLDVGGYPMGMCRLIAGAAMGVDFANPLRIVALTNFIQPTGADGNSMARLWFDHGIQARLACGLLWHLENDVRIFGSEGAITITHPWVVPMQGHHIIVHKGNQEIRMSTPSDRPVYALEIDVAGEAIRAGKTQAPAPAMTWADTLGNMQALDQWRETVNVTYDRERVENQTLPLTGRKLTRAADAKMQYAQLPGLGKPVSRLLMGTFEIAASAPHFHALFDYWFEQGGNAFDVAHGYRNGFSEQALGWWIRNRSIREQVVVLGKGAHTPWCDPTNLTIQLLESLQRLQTEYVDIYMMHRDNLAVPIGEFVAVLDEHVKAGRIKAIGVSNWSKERVDAFNAYAKQHAMTPIVAVSNNFSLARMIQPPWEGCIASSEPEYRAWHEKTGMALIAWSAQARGFFTAQGSPDNPGNAELRRCWYSDDNFARKARAEELAATFNVPTIAVALAYVLHQNFPTFGLIGPRSLEETRTSMQALDIRLSVQQLQWLEGAAQSCQAAT